MLRFEDLRVRDKQPLDRDFFNRRFRLIAETFGKLADEVETVTDDTDRLVTLGLDRVNEVLGPLLTKLQTVADKGFLVAYSSTPLTITEALEGTLVIAEEYRGIFQPTPYLLLSRQAENTKDDWAVLYVQGYNSENGGLAFEVLLRNGNIGNAERTDWVVSASVGISIAVLEAAANVQASFLLAEQAATDAAAAAAAAEAILESGPVSSVNGQIGAVSLAIGDIPNLTSTLGGKADSNHGHTIANISNLQVALDGKSATGHGHAVADVTGLQGALDGKAASSHTHAIANVTGLQGALDAKAASSHAHAISDVTGLQGALDAKVSLASVIGKQTIWVPSQSFFDTKAPPTKYWPNFGFMQVALDPVTEEGFGWTVVMPKAWDKGALEFRYLWAHPATTTNFGVYVDVYASGFTNGDNLAVAPWAASAGAADVGGLTDRLYISPVFTLTPETAGGSFADEELISFWGSRRPASGSDTLAVDMYLLGVIMKYNTVAARDD